MESRKIIWQALSAIPLTVLLLFGCSDVNPLEAGTENEIIEISSSSVNSILKEGTERAVFNDDGGVLDYEYSYEYDYIVGAGGFHIQTYLGDARQVIIPVEVNGNPVTGIKSYAFSECETLEQVVIPEGIKVIGNGAFNDCINLHTVVLPGTLESIGDSVFNGTAWLTGKLEEAKDGFVIVEGWLIAYKGEESVVIVPEGVQNIADSVFAGYEKLSEIKMPESLITIGSDVFNSCTNLKSVTVPASVTYMGHNVFSWSGLTEIYLLNPEVEIGVGAFDETPFCRDKENYQDNLLIVGKNLMGYWQYTNTYKDPVDINIPEGVRYINSRIKGTYNKVYIPEGVDYLKADSFHREYIQMDSLYIPNSVKAIEPWAFGDIERLTGLRLPDSTRIGLSAFPVEELAKNPDNYDADGFMRIGNYLIGYNGKGQLRIPEGVQSVNFAYDTPLPFANEITLLTIPESVEAIRSACFEQLSIQEVILPGTVQVVGDGLFRDCKDLKRVEIQEGVPYIPSSMFQNCIKLEEILIPDSVTYIGEGAFDGCKNLKYITIPDTVVYIGERAFSGCENLEQVIVPNGIRVYGDTFEGCPWQPVWDDLRVTNQIDGRE